MSKTELKELDILERCAKNISYELKRHYEVDEDIGYIAALSFLETNFKAIKISRWTRVKRYFKSLNTWQNRERLTRVFFVIVFISIIGVIISIPIIGSYIDARTPVKAVVSDTYKFESWSSTSCVEGTKVCINSENFEAFNKTILTLDEGKSSELGTNKGEIYTLTKKNGQIWIEKVQ